MDLILSSKLLQEALGHIKKQIEAAYLLSDASTDILLETGFPYGYTRDFVGRFMTIGGCDFTDEAHYFTAMKSASFEQFIDDEKFVAYWNFFHDRLPSVIESSVESASIFYHLYSLYNSGVDFGREDAYRFFGKGSPPTYLFDFLVGSLDCENPPSTSFEDMQAIEAQATKMIQHG